MVNIIIQTEIKPFAELKEYNQPYPLGMLIFDKEGYRENNAGEIITGVKIGDGVNLWKNIPYLKITEEIVSKWRKIAEQQGFGINNSKIVTLPDMHFAYMVVDAEKNAELIEEIMKVLIADMLYYKISNSGENLSFNASGILDFSLPVSNLDTINTISKISFTSKKDSNKVIGTKTYELKDATARQDIKNLENNVNNRINILENRAEDFSRINIRPYANMHHSQINFYTREQSTSSNRELYSYPSASLLITDGAIFDENGNVTDWGSQRFCLNFYHKNSANSQESRPYTQYRFPIIEDVSSSKVYDILAFEAGSALPISKGGTGATVQKTAAKNLNVVYKGNDADENNTTAGQSIFTNLSVKDAPNGKSIILAYDKSSTASTTFKRGLAIGSGSGEWVVYAKTDEDNKTRYCLGNDNVRVLQGSSVLRGAAWNDYAEAREANTLEAGRVVVEKGDGSMVISSERLMPSAKITSDTFGFIIGETKTCKTPIAVCGRVLAYPNEDRNTYSLGDAVCSGPNGTVSKMTREEIINYPERIIGTVSEIPDYEIWGEEEIKVNGRIWIYVR